ncbi:MFS transporter [Luteibacter sahnii]|uniref:MFS transporter n=1 Tax=Luteibacter sahnii TaxID=3021977 RepID=UPI002A6AA64E|nr:MFS transporter [Luteibacter sp. PPL193]MDY1549893.1 MFS transporter [Luteibacter sp. PPL193]
MMRVLGPVLTAHYLAAFTALGMPVFMPRVLGALAPDAPAWLAGALYVLPTVCTALTATTWGRLADRYGRRLSLLRAQLGLALGFAMAGFAPHLGWFVLALAIQGTCGGSLAAANAYLATQFGRDGSLARALDWTQFSARLAMVSAPALLGLAMAWGSPQALYRYLALLPLVAFAVTLCLPRDDGHATHAATRATAPAWRDWLGLLGVQFLFYFAMVVTFPYFVPYAERLGVTRDATAGLLYSLPHLVYLVALPWWRGAAMAPDRPLLLGLGVFSLACLAHAMAPSPAWIVAARLLYGAGMLLALGGLNRALGQRAAGGHAGHVFGLFDACGKWAGAAGGLTAGALVSRIDLAAPFVAAALAGLAAVATAALVFRPLKRSLHVPASDT